MRTTRMFLLCAAATLALGCGNDDGTGPSPTPSTVVGSWRATSLEYSMVSDPSIRVNFIALGAGMRLVLNEAKSFTLTMTYPGAPDEVVTGTWSLSGSTLTLNFEGGVSWLKVGSGYDTMTLVEEHGSFDFDNCGQDEDAHVNASFVRQ